MKIWISEKEEVCANCKYFIQYYAIQPQIFVGGISPVNAGHCTCGRNKDRKPGNPACEHFIVPDEAGGER